MSRERVLQRVKTNRRAATSDLSTESSVPAWGNLMAALGPGDFKKAHFKLHKSCEPAPHRTLR